MQKTRSPRDKNRTRTAGLFIFFLTFLIYLPALRNDFVDLDDYAYVVQNEHIRSLGWESLKWMLTAFHSSNWHPLSWFSHAVDIALFGMNPHMHHLTSILLHSLNTLLVFLLATTLISRARSGDRFATGNKYHDTPILAGAVTALLFGLHPIHVESVAWIAERKDVLCALFVLLSMLAYLRYTSPRGRSEKRWYLSTLVLFTMALMSKPMAVTLPVVLILLDIYPLQRIHSLSRKELSILVEKLPFLALSLCSSYITFFAQQSGGAVVALKHVGWEIRLLNAVKSLFFYLFKMAVPSQLVPFYPPPFHFDPLDPGYVLSLVLLVLITGTCLWMWKHDKPYWLVIWCCYIISLLPVLGIIQVGSQAAADRYTYLPSLVPFILMGVGAEKIWGHLAADGKIPKRLAASTLIVIMVLLTYGTERQIRFWKNGEVLLKYTVSVFPDTAFLPYNILGVIYAEKGMLDEAVRHYRKALEIVPNDPIILTNLGTAYGKKNLFDEAGNMFRRALAANPDYPKAHIYLGDIYMSQKSIEQAILEYLKGVEGDPRSPEGHYKLGLAYHGQGKLEMAVDEYRKAVEINPKCVECYYNLGIVYGRKGMYDEAEDVYKHAMRLDPANAEIHNNLAITYAQKGMFPEALASFEKAVALDPSNSNIYYNMSRLLAMEKNYEAAYRYAVKARRLGFTVPEDYLESVRRGATVPPPQNSSEKDEATN